MYKFNSFYKERPTLAALYAEDAAIFSLMQLPTDAETGLTVANFAAIALAECGELETIFSTAAALKSYLAVWSTMWVPAWNKMLSALNKTYDPLHNYDRTDTESETVTGEESESVTGSNSSEGTSDTTEGGSEQRDRFGAGFNSAVATGANVPLEREMVVPGKTVNAEESASAESSSERSGSSSTSRERELRSVGNIGVTTSQQMLQAEMELRGRYAIYYVILDAFRRDICVEVW